MNPKIAKNVIKLSLSGVVAIVIGYMIKVENHIDDKIDAHYASKEDPKTDQ